MSDSEAERLHRWLSALHQSPRDLLGDPEDYTFLMHQPQQTPPDREPERSLRDPRSWKGRPMSENTTTNSPEYLFAVKDQENESISWTRPEEIEKLGDDFPEDPPAIVIIDAAYWNAEGFWDDADLFEEISDQFGLSGITECVYEPYGTATFSSALARLLADPRFQRDDSI